MNPSAAANGGAHTLTREPTRPAAPAPPAVPAVSSLLDAVLSRAPESGSADLLRRFLSEPSPWKALAMWLEPLPPSRRPETVREAMLLLTREVARLDALVNRQLNAILHHPAFQKLEASWRGLRYLVHQVEEGENIKVRVLNVSWKELVRDLDRALEFDQSQLFKKVYNEEFGMPGGEPYGVLLGDYDVRPRMGPDYPTNDVEALTKVSQVAAAAFAPFIVAAHPAFFGLDLFTELEMPLDHLAKSFDGPEFIKWRGFRESEDARFVGLVLPRTLMRVPYADDGSRVDRFRFREDVEAPDRSQYLWGNAVYAFGSVLLRSFTEYGWLASIRGVERDEEDGGLVTGLPAHSFGTERTGVATKSCTDALITDQREKELGDLGFLPLCHCPDTQLAAFYGCQSVQKPKAYDDLPATVNARLSAMLHYMLCVARFAHYLKVIGRDRLGSFSDPATCEAYLNRWLTNYTYAIDDDDPEGRAKAPLRESRVEVAELPGKPGSYWCKAWLRPQFQIDQMTAAIRLATELTPGHG
jgi:type VI secretion system ImpC/EvpB family protein